MNQSSNHPLYHIIQLAQQHSKTSLPITPTDIEPFLNSYIRSRIVAKDDFISTIYTPTNIIYYIVTGSTSMTRSSYDGKNTLRVVHAPRFLGVDVTILSRPGYYPDIKALESCLVLEIDPDYFISSLKQNELLCFEVLHEICQNFYRISYRYDQTLFLDAPTKIMVYLLNQWQSHPEPKKQYTITDANSHIAEEIGISIRTFYRAVAKLKADHLLTIISGNITVNQQQITQIQHLLQSSNESASLPTLFKT